MNKKIICILLTFISLIGLKAQSEIPEEPPRPTAIFTSTFWGKSGTRSISYAPWGNFAEENSTKELVRVVNGALSKKFVYYGKDNFNFFQRKFFTEIELQAMEDKSDAKEVFFFCEIPFSSTEGETKEYIILFSPTKNKNQFSPYLVPFEEKEIPWGSYKLFSRYNETLYIAAGSKRFTLDSGKSMILNSKEFEGVRRVKMLIYNKTKGVYKEVAAQSFNVTDRQRGIFFISENRKVIDIVPMIDNKRPIEQAIGYGTKPLEVVAGSDSDPSKEPAVLQSF